MKFQNFFTILLCSTLMLTTACSTNVNSKTKTVEENHRQLQEILETHDLNEKQRYSIISQMANYYLGKKDYQGLILFLTDWVEENPDDMYNSYWLLMTAYAYLSTGAEPVAE